MTDPQATCEHYSPFGSNEICTNCGQLKDAHKKSDLTAKCQGWHGHIDSDFKCTCPKTCQDCYPKSDPAAKAREIYYLIKHEAESTIGIERLAAALEAERLDESKKMQEIMELRLQQHGQAERKAGYCEGQDMKNSFLTEIRLAKDEARQAALEDFKKVCTCGGYKKL